MRLLTHNQLVCVRKGCANHYPLDIQATQLEATYKQTTNSSSSGSAVAASAQDDQMEDEEDDDGDEEDELDIDFILHLMPNIDYSVLYAAATKLGLTGLPEKLVLTTLTKEKDLALLTRLHQVILGTHVQEGALQCGKCGRAYPIQQGIPNMRLNEDEVV